jgi:hypothetical protein
MGATQALALAVRHRAFYGALLVGGMAVAGVAQAQHGRYNLPPEVPASEIPALEEQRRTLLQQGMEAPGDVDKAFAYAVLSTRLGDYEAAIGVYERLLIQHPNTPRLQLELAALYFRLGSYPQAKALFTQVLERADTPDTVKMKVRGYLASIDSSHRRRSGFSGQLTVGARWEDNASAAPDMDSISLNGIDFQLSPESRAAADVSGQVGLNLRYRHLLSRHGDTVDVSFGGSSSRFRELDRLDADVAEVRLGPDFSLSRFGMRDARLSLQGIVGQTWLQGRRYMQSEGVAVGVRKPMGREAALAFSLDYRDENYTPGSAQASASNFSGQRYRGSVTYTRQAAANWQWMVGPGVERRDARAGYNSYWEPRINLGLSHRYAAPLGSGQQPWTFAVTGQLARRTNDEPMQVVSRTQKQKSNDALLQLTQTIPLRTSTELELFIGYRTVSSNYDIRDYANRFVGFSLAQRF